MTLAKKTTAASDLARELDIQWEKHSPSIATRLGVAIQALCELPEEAHAAWAPRLLRCVEDTSRDKNPLLPDALASSTTSSSNLCHSLSWGLFEAISERASMDACMALLAILPPPAAHTLSTAPASIAGALCRSTLPKLAQARRHDDIATIFERGFSPSLQTISDLLAHDGAVMDNPRSAKQIRDFFLGADIAQDSMNHREDLITPSYKNEMYLCSHPEFQKAALARFERGEPSLMDLANLDYALTGAMAIVQRSPERVARAKKAEEERSPRRMAARTWLSFDDAQRAVAQGFGERIQEVRAARMKQMATLHPAQAAQILMDAPTPGPRLEAYWNAIGLDKVSASEFLFTDFVRPTRGGVKPWQEKKRSWPMHSRESSGALECAGLEMSYLDCLALSGATRAELSAEAARGAKPHSLSQLLETKPLSRAFSEEDALWLSSFSHAPAPSKAKRILKA